ncbi:MAG: sigma-70 family RNA polymerase sigma factor, partial [bacterium]|nr:sigma-70 family RNA polymerase sigma factor [bacterium]
MADVVASDSIEVAWKAYHDQLHGCLKSRVGDAADDLLQEVFMRMYERRASLRDVEKLRSWMYRIAHHAVIDFYRARRPMESLPDGLTAEEPDADERAIQELAGCMAPMIENLPERYREAVMLSEIRGLSQ